MIKSSLVPYRGPAPPVAQRQIGNVAAQPWEPGLRAGVQPAGAAGQVLVPALMGTQRPVGIRPSISFPLKRKYAVRDGQVTQPSVSAVISGQHPGVARGLQVETPGAAAQLAKLQRGAADLVAQYGTVGPGTKNGRLMDEFQEWRSEHGLDPDELPSGEEVSLFLLWYAEEHKDRAHKRTGNGRKMVSPDTLANIRSGLSVAIAQQWGISRGQRSDMNPTSTEPVIQVQKAYSKRAALQGVMSRPAEAVTFGDLDVVLLKMGEELETETNKKRRKQASLANSREV